MNKERFSDEQIRQARQADLGAYLISQGEPLQREGRRYRHGENHKLVITGNSYFLNGEQETGNAVDYLCRRRGMDFKSAVFELIGASLAGEKTEKMPEATFSWENVALSSNLQKVVAYLNKSRGISYQTIQQLIDRQLIYQEAGSNNAVFPIRDEAGRIVGAELNGTLSEKRFKGLKIGSKYGYGYNISFDGQPRFMLFFESAVDLISFIDLKKATGKGLEGCRLVSMAGLKSNIVEHSLKAFKGNLCPVLCIDNDEAGQKFVATLESQIPGVKTHLPDHQYKDWNEQLLKA